MKMKKTWGSRKVFKMFRDSPLKNFSGRIRPRNIPNSIRRQDSGMPWTHLKWEGGFWRIGQNFFLTFELIIYKENLRKLKIQRRTINNANKRKTHQAHN